MINKFLLKSLTFICLLSSYVVSLAQHDPYYTHFRWNQQAFNPAFAGEKLNNICINGLSHFQWRNYIDQTFTSSTESTPDQKNIDNVAPNTYAMSANALIALSPNEQNQIGIGVTMVNDKLGFLKSNYYKVDLNYRIPIQGNFGYLAIGPSIGTSGLYIDNPRYKYYDPNDPQIPVQNAGDSKFDLGFGAFYFQKDLGSLFENFYVGVSFSHLTAPNISFPVLMANNSTNNYEFKFRRYAYISVGADKQLNNPNFKLEPAILIKYNPTLQMDYNLNVLYAQKIRGGIGFRHWGTFDAISLMLGGYIKGVQVGYSYDFTMSNLRTVSDGTHEIFLKYCFPIKFQDTPVKKWRLNTRRLGVGGW